MENVALQPKPEFISRDGRHSFTSQKALQYLFTTDVEHDRADIKATKGDSVQGSWDWVLQCPEFINWLASDTSILWISGSPGTGKTLLAVHLTEQLPLMLSSDEVLLYCFFNSKVDMHNNATSLVRSLIYQLIQLGKDPHKRYCSLGPACKLPVVWSMFVSILEAMENSRIVCVLDGLDECELKSLEALCSKLENDAPGLPVRFIVLSRERLTVVGSFLGRYPRIHLDDYLQQARGIIHKNIAEKLSGLPFADHCTVEEQERCHEILYRKSRGSHLWARLAVQSLQSSTASQVGATIDILPEGIEPLYRWLLSQVDPGERKFIHQILSWCAFSQRPMELTDLAEVLQIQADGISSPVDILQNRLQLYGALITVASHSRRYVFIDGWLKSKTIVHGAYHTVTLVHRTLFEYLTRSSASKEWFSLHAVAFHHSDLAKTCLACLASSNTRNCKITADKKEHNSFYDYARKNWSYHFQRCGEYAVDVVKGHPECFAGSPFLDMWFKSLDISQGSIWWRLGLAAAAAGLNDLVNYILKAEQFKLQLLKTKPFGSIAIRRLGTTPLHVAAKHGHLSTVKMLMEKISFALDLKDHNHYTPCFLAGMNGQHEVAEFLLHSGADLAKQHPLLRAIRSHDEAMVRLFLEWNPRISALSMTQAASVPIWVDGTRDSMLALLLPHYIPEQAHRLRQSYSSIARCRRRVQKAFGIQPSRPWGTDGDILFKAIRSTTSVKTLRALLDLPITGLGGSEKHRCILGAFVRGDIAIIKLLVEEYGFPIPIENAIRIANRDGDKERSLEKLRLIEVYRADPSVVKEDEPPVVS
jgi:hypothetical protein